MPMSRDAGLPAVQGSRLPRCPANPAGFSLAVLLSLSLLSSSTISPTLCAHEDPRPTDRPGPSRDQESPSMDEASLRKSLAMIAEAFRGEKPEAMNDIFPKEGKVFLSLRSVKGGAAGYFSSDQVYFILKSIFSNHDTIRFEIRMQKAEQKRGNLFYSIGTWAFRSHDGPDGENTIHFVFCHRKQKWSLVEIREAH